MEEEVKDGLTSDFKLVVLLGFEQRVGEAVPGQLLPDLRQQVVCEQAHRAQQRVQNVAEEGLRDTNRPQSSPNTFLPEAASTRILFLSVAPTKDE